VGCKIAHLPRRSDELRADPAFGVDHEGGSVRETLLFQEYAVLAGDRAVGPEVRQQSEVESLLICPGTERVAGVDRDAEQLDALGMEEREVVSQLAEFSGAQSREGEREEDQCDRLASTEIMQGDFFAVLVGEGEVGS